MSDSVRPHRQQPTWLPHPWDSPGKNTGVGCHFLLQCMKVKSESEVAQLCPTLSDPMDCSLPGSSVHGIFQTRVLQWGAIAFSALWAYFAPNEAKHSSHIVLFFPLVDKDELLRVSQLRLPLNQLNTNHDCFQAISAGQPHQPQHYEIIKHCFKTQKILKSQFPAPFPVIQVQQVWIYNQKLTFLASYFEWCWCMWPMGNFGKHWNFLHNF